MRRSNCDRKDFARALESIRAKFGTRNSTQKADVKRSIKNFKANLAKCKGHASGKECFTIQTGRKRREAGIAHSPVFPPRALKATNTKQFVDESGSTKKPPKFLTPPLVQRRAKSPPATAFTPPGTSRRTAFSVANNMATRRYGLGPSKTKVLHSFSHRTPEEHCAPPTSSIGRKRYSKIGQKVCRMGNTTPSSPVRIIQWFEENDSPGYNARSLLEVSTSNKGIATFAVPGQEE